MFRGRLRFPFFFFLWPLLLQLQLWQMCLRLIYFLLHKFEMSRLICRFAMNLLSLGLIWPGSTASNGFWRTRNIHALTKDQTRPLTTAKWGGIRFYQSLQTERRNSIFLTIANKKNTNVSFHKQKKKYINEITSKIFLLYLSQHHR